MHDVLSIVTKRSDWTSRLRWSWGCVGLDIERGGSLIAVVPWTGCGRWGGCCAASRELPEGTRGGGGAERLWVSRRVENGGGRGWRMETEGAVRERHEWCGTNAKREAGQLGEGERAARVGISAARGREGMKMNSSSSSGSSGADRDEPGWAIWLTIWCARLHGCMRGPPPLPPLAAAAASPRCSVWQSCMSICQKKSHTAALSLSLAFQAFTTTLVIMAIGLSSSMGSDEPVSSLSLSTLKLASRQVQQKRAGGRLHLGARGQALRVHAVGCMNASPRRRGASGFLEHFLAPLGLPFARPHQLEPRLVFCLTLPSLSLRLGLATRLDV